MSIIKVGDIFEIRGYFLEVVEYIKHNNILVKCLGLSEDVFNVRSEGLRKGNIKNPYERTVRGVGYIGVGKFKIGGEGSARIAYNIWKGIIERCYTDTGNNSYIECTVHQHWHNFQNFATWYTSQKFCGEGYDIDKDLLSKGVKIYSSDTCCLLPSELNTLISRNPVKKSCLPVGVYPHYSGTYVSTIRIGKESRFLGVFSNTKDASRAYRRAKIESVKDRLLFWENKIDEGLTSLILERVVENIDRKVL